jgi:hypothetical protein
MQESPSSEATNRLLVLEKIPPFIVPKNSLLLRSADPVTGVCPKPDKSNLRPQTFFKFHFNIIALFYS